jgi:hypothetical protein
MRALIAGAVAVALALLPAPATAEEDQISGRPAVSGSFLHAERGFFLCFETDLSPTGTPDCVLGYVVPTGDEGAGRLRVIGSGFQRTTSYTVLEDIYVDPGMLAIDGTALALHVEFPEFGRLDVDLVAAPVAGQLWTNASCPATVMRYGVAAGGQHVSRVDAVRGKLSRGHISESIRGHATAPAVPSCYSFFSGATTGWWRIEEPHSAGKRRLPISP